MFDIKNELAFGSNATPQALAAAAAGQVVNTAWAYVIRITEDEAHLLRGLSTDKTPTVVGKVNLGAANKLVEAIDFLCYAQPKSLADYRAFLTAIGKGDELGGTRVPVARSGYSALIKIKGYHPLKGGDINDDMRAITAEWDEKHGAPETEADRELRTTDMIRSLQEIGYEFTPNNQFLGELFKIQGTAYSKSGCTMSELLDGHTLPEEVAIEFRRDPWEARILREFTGETLLALSKASRVYKRARKSDEESSTSMDWQAFFAGTASTRKGGKRPQYNTGEEFTGLR